MRRVVTALESPRLHQLWRFVRLGGLYLAGTGIVSALVSGTATRGAIIAAAVGVAEVLYRAAVPPAPKGAQP